MTQISRSQPWSVDCSGTSFSPYTLDAINFLLANRSYHRFPYPPRRAHLCAFFSSDADTDAELLCLAHALAQFPARTFRTILLCFSRYNLVHAKPLNELYHMIQIFGKIKVYSNQACDTAYWRML